MSANPDLQALEQRRDAILAELQTIGDMRPGSLTHRYMQCGKSTCRCQQPGHPGHGPYFVFARQVDGKRTSRSLSKSAAARVQAQLDEYQRFARLSSELLAVNEQLCDARLRTDAAADSKSAKKKLRT